MSSWENTVLQQLGSLIETIAELNSTAEIYDCIVNFIPQILSADHVTITSYNSMEHCIVVQAIYATKEADLDLKVGEQMPSFTSYQAYAQSVCVPIIYKPTDNLDREVNVKSHEAGLVSIMIVPLISGLEIVGTINIGSRTHDYQEADKFRLEKISALVATAITHNKVFESNGQVARHRLYAQHLEHLNVLSENLLLTESVQEALHLVADCATQLVSARRVSFCELCEDPDYVKIVALAGKSDDSSGTIILLKDSGLEASLLHNQNQHVTDLLNSNIKAQQSLGESGYNHIWSFPIVSNAKRKRCLNITSVGTELHISDAMSVLDTLARLANSTIERIAAQMETVRQAKTDPLTGLCNRKEFNEKLESAIASSEHHNDTCIVYLDLDLFKNVNDTMGHVVGDQVLIEMARRLQHVCSNNDTLARIGGDEFMILLTKLDTRSPLETIARTLIESISEPIKLQTQEITIGASAGICRYPEHGKTGSELVKNADIAMYKAKEIGRNQYYVFTEELSRSLSERLQLQKDLVVALEEDQLSLVFQPQYDIKKNRIVGAEVLVRWQHNTLGWVPPDVFIPVAENCGLIGLVTDWVLKNALTHFVVWQKSFPELRLAVNISAVEFSPQLQLISRLKSALDLSGVDPTALEIELTETAFLKHPEHAAKLAGELSELGIHIALDDFGTGYASLSYLIQLPINCIKIDRSFVDGVELDVRKQAVVAGILVIAKGLNISCLGEGVETQEQLAWLSDAGCNAAQGYLLSKPISANQLTKLIDANASRNPRAA